MQPMFCSPDTPGKTTWAANRDLPGCPRKYARAGLAIHVATRNNGCAGALHRRDYSRSFQPVKEDGPFNPKIGRERFLFQLFKLGYDNRKIPFASVVAAAHEDGLISEPAQSVAIST